MSPDDAMNDRAMRPPGLPGGRLEV